MPRNDRIGVDELNILVVINEHNGGAQDAAVLLDAYFASQGISATFIKAHDIPIGTRLCDVLAGQGFEGDDLYQDFDLAVPRDLVREREDALGGYHCAACQTKQHIDKYIVVGSHDYTS